MGQEERNPKCSISSYGGVRTRSSKKQKQKKVPQRGLGVAQLEKIRIEEQQKNYASVPAVSTLTPPQDSDPDMSVPAKGTAPLAKAFKYGGLENPGQYDTAYSNWNDRVVWNSCEHIAEDGHEIDPRFSLCTKLPLPSESDYLWPLSGLHQYDPPPSSMVMQWLVIPGFQFVTSNLLSFLWSFFSFCIERLYKNFNVVGILQVNASTTSSSFILNSQTEPPSNQIYHSNYAPIQQEEEKVCRYLDNPRLPFSEHPSTQNSSFLRTSKFSFSNQ